MKSNNNTLQLRCPEEGASRTDDRIGRKIVKLENGPENRLNHHQETHDANIPMLLNLETIEKLVEWKKQEKRLIGRRIQANMDRMVYPIIDTLREHISPSKRNLLSLLESCLEDVLSPLVLDLGLKFNTLSPREIEICSMISKGYSTKYIASLKNISELTVNDHRKSIRKKLGLTNTKRNLSSFLRSTERIQSEQ